MEKRILIVENDLEMEDVFKEIFQGDDYTVFFYEETEDIIELLEKHEPGIVILDYNLNGLNGGELCKLVKAHSKFKDIPVLLLSAFPKFIYNKENVGYDAFLEKPFDVEELQNIVKHKIVNGRSK
ncbi:response regulator [Pedobacter nutrimenti]|jgi:DNA-binding response OmpR family regulator|uniref:Response regulator receiver domain-containing protein n=1 Tax=Pedobacter nutrimenti TaxID=1241337 RepID=A0A318UKX6_9SPHI|nr:response regulator [Pedobacter nutrimenti]PYF76723.1 response regulator receiver domain-containing protein [Pedobacter nutrimenti]